MTEKVVPQPQAEGTEAINKPKEEIYLRTDKGAVKGELVEEKKGERIVRTTWTHDGKSVGAIVRMPDKVIPGQPVKMWITGPDGKERPHETATLQLAARGEQGSFITLDEMIAASEKHERSAALPANEQHTEQEYTDAMPEYMYVSEAKDFAHVNPDAAKCEVPFDDLDIGWKAHLNIEPKDVPQVSQYLKQNQYAHKYLTGGVGTEGKAFTVYFGSRAMMNKWAEQLSQDLSKSLRKPQVTDEMEIAAGVVGRFTAGDQRSGDFAQYGDFGLVPRKQYLIAKGNWRAIKTREDKIDLAVDAYRHLAQKYGKYFHG